MKLLLKSTLLAASALAPLALAGTAPAFAQEAATEDDSGTLAEIVVTARKTEETLSDAPVAISVLTADAIAEQGFNSIEDFAKQATGISFSQAFGRSTDRPVIRGQSNVLAGVQFGVETGAAYFVDGVYYQGDIQGFDPLSIERVEIVKGPQSALYGRNTYSGAINYITKDPTSDFTVSGRATAAENDEYQIAAAISGPLLGDAVGFRLGGRYYTYGGEYTNQLTGKKVGQEETKSVYATLVIKPFDDLKIRLRGQYQKDDDGPLAIFLTGAENNNCRPGFRSLAFRQGSAVQPALYGTSTNNNQYFCGPIQARPDNVRLNTDPVATVGFGTRDGTAFDGIENEQYLFSSVIDWDLGGSGWVLSSLTGYRDNTNFFGTDSDHSEAFFFLFPSPANATSEPAFTNSNRDEAKDFSQEIRIASPQDARVRGLAGLYYFNQKLQTVDLTFANPRAGEALGTNASAYSTIEDKAAFALLAADLTDKLTITGEIRYAEETKTVIDRAAATSIFCAGQSGRATQFGFTGTCRPKGKWTGWDPRVTIDYKPSDNLLIYAVYAQGRKPGGFNGTGGLTALALTGEDLTEYQEEKAKTGEIGVKFDTADRRFQLVFSAFYNDLSAVQLTRSLPPSAPGQTTTSVAVNTGNARTKGFELELRAAPSSEFNASLGFSYVDAKFTKGCDFDYFVLNSGGLQPNFNTANPSAAGLPLCDISGKRLPLGSEFIVNGAVNYEKPIGNGGLSFISNANFSLESKKYIQTDNLAYVPGAFLLNARLGIRGDNFTVVAFGRNLTGEDAPPLATRWFDYRYGNAARGLPAPGPNGIRTGTFDGRPAVIDTGAPRAFFAPLRKGRTFGVEATFNF